MVKEFVLTVLQKKDSDEIGHRERGVVFDKQLSAGDLTASAVDIGLVL